METINQPDFNEREVALGLGYSEDQVDHFGAITKLEAYWKPLIEEGLARLEDMPRVEKSIEIAYENYCEKMRIKRAEFYIKSVKPIHRNEDGI